MTAYRICRPGSCWIVALLVTGSAYAAEPRPKARELDYDPKTGQWVESPPPVPGTALGDLQLARQAHARQDYRRAKGMLKKWLKTYGDTEPDYVADALLLEAEIHIARRDYYKAHENLQEVLDSFAGTEAEDRAYEFEFVVAEVFLTGVKRKWLGMRILSTEDTALTILDDITAARPETSLAQQAIRTKARYFFERGEFALAELEYSRLVQEYPRSRYARHAMRQSADAALASFAGIEFDDAALIEAEERYYEYLAQYPGAAEQEGIGQMLQQIHTQRAAKEYSIGRYYEKTRHPGAAVFYYRSTCENWPDTIAASQARQRLERLGQPLQPLPVNETMPEETESAS